MRVAAKLETPPKEFLATAFELLFENCNVGKLSLRAARTFRNLNIVRSLFLQTLF
jgi:hypothetical protein